MWRMLEGVRRGWKRMRVRGGGGGGWKIGTGRRRVTEVWVRGKRRRIRKG